SDQRLFCGNRRPSSIQTIGAGRDSEQEGFKLDLYHEGLFPSAEPMHKSATFHI
ncbi:AGC protein kinase, partial [Puccinia sorghi]